MTDVIIKFLTKQLHLVCIGKMHLELLLLLYAGGTRRQFAPRFMNSAHGSATDRSADGSVADVSARVILYCVSHQKYALSVFVAISLQGRLLVYWYFVNSCYDILAPCKWQKCFSV